MKVLTITQKYLKMMALHPLQPLDPCKMIQNCTFLASIAFYFIPTLDARTFSQYAESFVMGLDAFACFVLYLIITNKRNKFGNFIIKMENLIELRMPYLT